MICYSAETVLGPVIYTIYVYGMDHYQLFHVCGWDIYSLFTLSISVFGGSPLFALS